MTYSGKFKPINSKKYQGNLNDITYRSLWEASVMIYCDKTDSVLSWSSESIVVPYVCPTDNKMHRYFVDFMIKFSNNRVYLIEVKPEKDTKVPICENKKQGKRFQKKLFTYLKNQAKWKAASEYAKSQNWNFQVWTEKTLKAMNINILQKKS